MPDKIQSRVVPFWRQEVVTRMALGTICSQRRRQPQRPVPLRERWQGDAELELARQRLERQQPGFVFRNSLHFSLGFALGEFCFNWVCCNCLKIWPFQPPSILPISSILSESAIYLLSFSDLVSHKTISKTFNVSVFLIANLTQGCFSSLLRKLAMAIPSIISINRLSIFWPKEWRWVLGRIW